MAGHLRLALAAALLSIGGATPLASQVAPQAVLPAPSKKLVRAAKRQKVAEAESPWLYRRSKNPPTKRSLRANRLHVSRRVRRKHRRARS